MMKPITCRYYNLAFQGRDLVIGMPGGFLTPQGSGNGEGFPGRVILYYNYDGDFFTK